MNYINNMEIKKYFDDLTAGCKLTNLSFKCVDVTGLNSLEGVLASQRTTDGFIAVEIPSDGVIEEKIGNHFNDRVTTIYILKKFKATTEGDQRAKLMECRLIFKEFRSRIFSDRENIEDFVFATQAIPYSEFDSFLGTSFTGLYFHLKTIEPENLIVNPDLWL